MLNEFTVDYPPADLLIAAYMGIKPRGQQAGRQQAMKDNAAALKSVPLPRGSKTIEQMPEFIRTPEMMALIQKMKAGTATAP